MKYLYYLTIPITAILYTLHVHYVWWVCLISPQPKRTWRLYRKYEKCLIFEVSNQIKERYK